jgi:hypothetical protein
MDKSTSAWNLDFKTDFSSGVFAPRAPVRASGCAFFRQSRDMLFATKDGVKSACARHFSGGVEGFPSQV